MAVAFNRFGATLSKKPKASQHVTQRLPMTKHTHGVITRPKLSDGNLVRYTINSPQTRLTCNSEEDRCSRFERRLVDGGNTSARKSSSTYPVNMPSE